MATKFTKKDIHAKFLSNEIDDAIMRRVDKVDWDMIAVVLADRLAEVLKQSRKKENVKEHCFDLINRKVN